MFYSAYVPVVENTLLPSPDTKPPLLREHRLYQADWLLRFYGFRAEELLDADDPNFNPSNTRPLQVRKYCARFITTPNFRRSSCSSCRARRAYRIRLRRV